MEKKFIQSCTMRRTSGRGMDTSFRMKMRQAGVDRKTMEKIYNRFYRDQVAALYRAVSGR